MRLRSLFILLLMLPVGFTQAQETRQLSAEAEALLETFHEIYGEKIISGCTANVNWNINEAKWVYQHTGKWPAINFFDFIHLPFSPANWIDYTNVTEVVNWHKAGGIVGCMWHWNMPANNGSDWTCTPGTGDNQTSFDVKKIFEPESDEYKQMMKDIDKVASTLKKLKQRKIPVLWRPLHEAGGRWFWWGLDAEACNELWRVMYDRFTNHHGLNNLIWVWTSAAEWNKPYSDGYKWYPGDEYVDIVFANETEATAFTKLPPREALDEMANHCDIAVVKIGKKGSMVKQGDEYHFIEPWPAIPIDATGAGDTYAAGFLYAHSLGMPLKVCGEVGSIIAAKVVEIVGTKIDIPRWRAAKQEIRKLIAAHTK